MENKIDTFSTLPNEELSKVGATEKPQNAISNSTSIENEFKETNQHTKQTQQTANNTDNTGNTSNTDNTVNDTNAGKKKNRLGSLMKGGLPIKLVDIIIPSTVVYLYDRFGYIMDKKDLKLSKDEMEALEPAIQDVLDEIELNFDNVWVNLGVMLAIVYGAKLIDKAPTLKKKVAEVHKEKKTMSEAVATALNEPEEISGEMTDMGKFEIEYNKLLDTVRLDRRRGVGDAKEYIANNYNERVKAIARKYNIDFSQIDDLLNWTHTPKKRQKKVNPGEDFNLD